MHAARLTAIALLLGSHCGCGTNESPAFFATVSASSSTAKVSPTIPADKQPLAPEAAKPKVQIPAASKDTPATSKVEEAAIQSALAVWAKAWSQKDMPRYLSAYADTFTPSEKMSRA
jgi:hypothetical protein